MTLSPSATRRALFAAALALPAVARAQGRFPDRPLRLIERRLQARTLRAVAHGEVARRVGLAIARLGGQRLARLRRLAAHPAEVLRLRGR